MTPSAPRSLDAAVNHWLNERGLSKNPFDILNADQEPDLSHYFVDLGQFDDLQRLPYPCLIFAHQGCGKTAQRRMLASYCRPEKRDSEWLAVHYTYTALERALRLAGGEAAEARDIHHVRALLRQGLMALDDEAQRDAHIASVLERQRVARRLAAYQAQFAPHLVSDALRSAGTELEELGAMELLQGFVSLVEAVGLKRVFVLVDGLDEFLLTAADPAHIVTLLAPLLGTLSLIEQPGLAFRFFLPQVVERPLYSQPWFRPDRVRVFYLLWSESAIEHLLRERLTHYSAQGSRLYSQLGELCAADHDLNKHIDHELARLAEGVPRTALILADRLLRVHCQQAVPPPLISAQSWQEVQVWWAAQRAARAEVATSSSAPVASPDPTSPAEPDVQPVAELSPLGWPVLVVDKGRGLVYLGTKEIRRQLTRKEYQVLVCLYQHREQVCPKYVLAQEAWPEYSGMINDSLMSSTIRRLRPKLGQTIPERGYIETLTGEGYRLHPAGFSL